MIVQIELNCMQIEQLFVEELAEQLRLVWDKAPLFDEDVKAVKQTKKALKKVLRYNTTPDEYRKIIKRIKKEYKDA